MFGYINQRFLCFSAIGLLAAIIQTPLYAQVQISGSASHYRSLGAHLNAGDENLDILGMGTDPTDGVTFILCKTGTTSDCPSSDQIHIYRHDTASNLWVFENSIDHQGYVNADIVDVSEGTVVFGRSFGQAFGNDGADIYRRTAGGVWIHEAMLLPADNFPGNQFGKSVSIHENRVAIGAPKDDPDDDVHAWEGKGSVYIYDRIGSNWTLTEKVTVPDGLQGDEFGESVAIQNTSAGWKLIVGAPDHSTDPGGINQAGALYAFINSSGQWTQTDKLVTTNAQNTSGRFGDHGIGFDGEIVAAVDFSDLWVYEMNASGQLNPIGTWFGTASISDPVVFNREILIGDPNGDLVSSAGVPNVTQIQESSPGTWITIQHPRPQIFQNGDSYAHSIAFNGGVFLAGAPQYDGAGINAGGIWSESLSGFTYPTGLIVEGQASPFSEFGHATVANDSWAFVGIPSSIDVCNAGNSGSVRVYNLVNDQWSMVDTLFPVSPASGTEFGKAIALDGDRLAVSMPGHHSSGSGDHFGGVAVFEFDGIRWVQAQFIEGSSADQGFGDSIALSGTLLAVGMPDTPTGGQVGMFELDASNLFQFQTNLVSDSVSNTARFGSVVSLLGDELLVGAPDHNNREGSISGWTLDQQSGSWLSRNIPPVMSTVAGSRLGSSIVQNQDFAFVGLPGTSIVPGRVAVYPRSGQGFGPPFQLSSPASTNSSGFGASIASSDHMLAVGHDDPTTTQAHFMAFDGNTFQLIQTVSVPSGNADARFGSALAFGAQTLFVAAVNDDSNAAMNAGSVHLFETQTRYTVPECDMAMESDRIQWIEDDLPNPSEWFAYSVEVDEGYAIAGQPYEQHSFIYQGSTINGTNAGKATIYERTGLRQWTPVAMFRGGNFDDPIGIVHSDWLGWSVDIEQTTAVAGGIQGRITNPAPSGSVRVYERGPSGWSETHELFPPTLNVPGADPIREMGASVDLDSTANFISTGATNSAIGITGTGAGFVFERVGSQWISSDPLLPTVVNFGDHIGTSSTVEEGWAAFGATDDDTNGGSAGAVHIFRRSALGLWGFHSTLYPPNPIGGANFGKAIELSRSDLGLTLVVGAFNERVGFVNSLGAAYVFVLDETLNQWSYTQKLLPEFAVSSAQYGTDLSIDHNTIAIGGPSLRDTDTGQSSQTGGVEVYNLDPATNLFVRRTTIRPEINQWNSGNGWGSAVGLSGGTVFMGSRTADGELYDPVNANLNYGAMVAHDIICIPDCPADINGDGMLNFLDVSAFLAAFSNQDPSADQNNDGVFNFLDVSAFLASFSLGCS